MTTKHTPGPWVIGKRDHDVVMVDTASGTAICDVYGESDDRPANARLIAAAPDLLAALKGVIAVADRNTVEFDAARAALAKAQS